MPADVHHDRYTRPKYSFKVYTSLMKTLENTLATEISDVAVFRAHVIHHYEKHGLKSTLDAFNIKQSTFYDWRKTYKESGRRTIFLVPKSTAPYHVRIMKTDWRLIEFIKEMRKEYGNIGKNIIKPFLDAYAVKLRIKSIGLTTIGKIIKRRKFTFEKRLQIKKKNKFSKLRIRKSPKVTSPGFIQMDSIKVTINDERYLFMCVIDIFTKFAYVSLVNSISSQEARRVFIEFMKLNPTKVRTVQTDNGSEFLNVFHEYLESISVRHQFIYPRHPKINGTIERFNRTVQEEFIMRNDEIYYDLNAFQQKLDKYLNWYNYQRPHGSLHYMSPMNFIQSQLPKCG